MKIDRRAFVVGAPLALAGCATEPGGFGGLGYGSMYGSVSGEPFPVPAIDTSQINPRLLRREVTYKSRERPGTIVVDPRERYAYYLLGNDKAIRYGVGVGREEAFNFRGTAIIGNKAEWPRWTPTPAMIQHEPKRYGPYAGGMNGGPDNPLGPRALYLYRDGRDTYYRLHGTTEPYTIGTMVSSGCIRFMNQDIIDLYKRTPVGTKVVVLPIQGGAREVS